MLQQISVDMTFRMIWTDPRLKFTTPGEGTRLGTFGRAGACEGFSEATARGSGQVQTVVRLPYGTEAGRSCSRATVRYRWS